MKLPRWCIQFISPNEIHAVSQAVKHAEEKTSGEIIPMIVKRSGSLGHLSFQLFTICCLLATFVYIALENFTNCPYSVWIAMGLIAISWPISEVLSHRQFLQRIFTLPAEQAWQVQARATLEFYGAGLQKTKGHTGVLIFLSLMERKCVVLADEGIAQKLPPETWKGIVDSIVEGIRKGKTGDGLIKGIEECGRILTQHFPITTAHENEIPNQLIIKD